MALHLNKKEESFVIAFNNHNSSKFKRKLKSGANPNFIFDDRGTSLLTHTVRYNEYKHCGVVQYLPDPLWLSLHPVKKMMK